MIADLDKTIRQLLIDELPPELSEVAIKFDAPTREWSQRQNGPTLNFYLYDVRENPHLRAHQWEQRNLDHNGRPLDPQKVHQKRTPLRIDCFYMVTTWMNQNPEDEHRLLTNCLLVLARYPVLPADRLVERLRNPTFEVRAQVARHDVLTNPAEVWGALNNDIRPTVPYVVTLTLDPWRIPEDLQSVGPVRTLGIGVGQEGTPAELANRRLSPAQADPLHRFIWGTVRDPQKQGAPVANLEVAIEGVGLYTRTDAQGRFRFAGLMPGAYTLVVRISDTQKAAKKPINVPPKLNENYDMEV